MALRPRLPSGSGVATALVMTKEMEKRKAKSGAKKGRVMNRIVAGIDLGDSESLVTVLSPVGNVTYRFLFQMNDEGYSLFASIVRKDARVAFEAQA